MGKEPAYKTSRKPLIDAKFANPSGWPKADSGKVSIFEAICIVGRSQFGAAWDETELRAMDWPQQPQEAHDVFTRDMERLFQNSGGGAPGSGNRIHQQNKALLEELAKRPDAHVRAYFAERLNLIVRAEQAYWVENANARHRLSAAIEWLAQHCRDGDLVSYARLVVGGDLYPMGASEWNVENPFQKFVCEGSFKRYFGASKQSYSVYVFFDRAAVEQAVVTLANAPAYVSTLDLQALSPFLRLAVTLALKKGYTAKSHPDTQAVREAEVSAAWSEAMADVPESKRAVEAIARVMGFPNSEAIKQGKSRVQAKMA